eukprot:TRINITY_DN33171_c0_g1_i1.p1 TRINITY_DN33171_c0_g1~~TRINITY_DN33171_c0_g1_i1.p1  ORF type:complete len:178 (-),score=27.69 TRINITY_DN33171_c0_g1_i1:58-591(-)
MLRAALRRLSAAPVLHTKWDSRSISDYLPSLQTHTITDPTRRRYLNFKHLYYSSDAYAAEKILPSQYEELSLTDNCIRRMRELQKEDMNREIMLRLSVESGGCSGFQYGFSLDSKRNPDDRVFEKEGVKLLVDNVSYELVKGATVDYVEELIRSSFMVTKNPNAEGGCSCGSSFVAK